MAMSRVLFIGDSSLFCRRTSNTRKKTKYIDEILEQRRIPGLKFESRRYNGGHISGFLEANPEGFDKVGISYFGNDASDRWTGHMQAEKFQQWTRFLRRLQRTNAQKVIFWVGGFSLKYDLQPHYDTQMNLVRSWIREAGFQVVTAFDKVAAWEMGNQQHVHINTQEELGDFWLELLSDDPLPPSYFSQTLPTTALVFNKGWCSANGQVPAAPGAAVQEQLKPKKRWLRNRDPSVAALAAQVAVAEVCGQRYEEEQLEPKKRWLRNRDPSVAALAAQVAVAEVCGQRYEEEQLKRILRPPAGLVVEISYHRSNVHGKILWFYIGCDIKDAQQFFEAHGTVIHRWHNHRYGWLEFDTVASAQSVLAACSATRFDAARRTQAL